MPPRRNAAAAAGGGSSAPTRAEEDELRVITLEEMGEHTAKDDLWLAVDGKV